MFDASISQCISIFAASSQCIGFGVVQNTETKMHKRRLNAHLPFPTAHRHRKYSSLFLVHRSLLFWHLSSYPSKRYLSVVVSVIPFGRVSLRSAFGSFFFFSSQFVALFGVWFLCSYKPVFYVQCSGCEMVFFFVFSINRWLPDCRTDFFFRLFSVFILISVIQSGYMSLWFDVPVPVVVVYVMQVIKQLFFLAMAYHLNVTRMQREKELKPNRCTEFMPKWLCICKLKQN